ncbi:hypothetical protein ACFX2G_044333 [Malus domestica]
MGIPSELRDMWVNHKDALVIPSPAEEAKLLRSKKCIDEGVQEGFKYGAVAAVISSVATLGAVRTVPWAKYNLNYTAQALIISAATISTYFITVDKTILACARKNALLQDSLRRQREQ